MLTTSGTPLLLGDLGDGDGLAGVEGADQHVAPASIAFSAWVRATSGLVSVS